MLTIDRISFSQLESDPDFPRLVEDYATESRMPGLPSPIAKLPTYRTLNENGLLTVFVAKAKGKLIGFVMVLFHEIPHYSLRVAMTESFFVFKWARSTGAGVSLRKIAEEFAREAGSCGLFISTPVTGTLMDILPRVGYTKTNEVFFKSFSHE